jgi:hypothetical protein
VDFINVTLIFDIVKGSHFCGRKDYGVGLYMVYLARNARGIAEVTTRIRVSHLGVSI